MKGRMMAEKKRELVARWERRRWRYKGEKQRMADFLNSHLTSASFSLSPCFVFCPFPLCCSQGDVRDWTAYRSLSVPLASSFHTLPHKILSEHWKSVHYLTRAFVCLSEERPVLTPARSCHSITANTWLPLMLSPTASTSVFATAVYTWMAHECNKQTPTHLRGPPSSYGGMMTTLTVTDVLSRSIICSWVSVTAATLQISTNRLPCLSPACQAKPYSSTCQRIKTTIKVFKHASYV